MLALVLLLVMMGTEQLQADDTPFEEAEYEQLYAAPAGVVVLLSLFYGGISILAVIGNSLVIWVVATTRQMRTVTNMYIANLAFADVIIGIFCIPFQFQAALLQQWNLPWFMCGFCPFVQAVSVNVSVFTLTAIAIDRHRAIINPLRARPTKFISKFIICLIWLVAFTFAIPCAIAFRVEVMHERIKENYVIYNVTRPFCMNKNLSEDQLQTYRYSLVFVQYLVPFCVISFVYIQMAVRLWGTRAPGNAQDTRDITLLKNKKKVIKMLIIVVVVFGVCWLPLQLYNILYVTIPEINEYRFINIVWFCCDWLAMSNSCYNPFIYGIYNEKFKREFNKRFSTWFCKFRTSNQMQDRTMSMHTRASSVRSSYTNSSMRMRQKLLVGQANYCHGMQNAKIQQQNENSIYNIFKFSSDKSKNKAKAKPDTCKNITLGTVKCPNNKELLMFATRKSNWRPKEANLFECDDDSTFSTHSEPSSVAINKTTVIEQDLDKSLSCVCEKELGKSIACDGTCILNEVSRVQLPSNKQRTTCAAEHSKQIISNNNNCTASVNCLTNGGTVTLSKADEDKKQHNGNVPACIYEPVNNNDSPELHHADVTNNDAEDDNENVDETSALDFADDCEPHANERLACATTAAEADVTANDDEMINERVPIAIDIRDNNRVNAHAAI